METQTHGKGTSRIHASYYLPSNQRDSLFSIHTYVSFQSIKLTLKKDSLLTTQPSSLLSSPSQHFKMLIQKETSILPAGK